jgi:crotonobetainyl-CoA:carnitine CoA-transferase CaiB-like acyl-CoA transferase
MGSSGARPLEGLRVVALEQAVSMPYCTFLLAELGAEVIKLERLPSGDVIRAWDAAAAGFSTGYVWVNSNKRSVGIDMKSDEGRDVVLKLIESADVFAENFAPGVVKRLGVGFESAVERRADIIYCSISGYGQTGPYADRKAYDLLIQGESGLLMVSGQPDSPAKIGIPVTDLVAGTNAAVAILAALQKRVTDRQPQYLDIAMLDSIMPWLGYYPHHVWHTGNEPGRTGMHHQYITPYGPYPTGDGQLINIAVADDRQWVTLCRDVLETPELLDDLRFATVISRHQNREVLMPRLEERLATRSSTDWLERMLRAGIPSGEVRSIRDAIEHPQVIDHAMRAEAESEAGPLPVFRAPFAEAAGISRRIPSLGEATNTVLADIGYSDNDIEKLRDVGAVG